MAGNTDRLQRLTRIAITVIVVQAAFWFAVYQPLLSIPPSRDLDKIELTNARIASLEVPSLEAAEGAAHSSVNLPHTLCCEPVYASLQMNFDLEAVPARGLGMLTYHQVDNMLVAVNGSIVVADGSLKFGRQTFQGQQGKVVRIPSGLLRAGSNTIAYVIVRDGYPYTDLYPPILAPIDQVQPWAARRLWQQGDYFLIAGWTTFLLGLFAMLLIWRAENRLFAAWLATVCFTWTGLAAYALVLDQPIGGTLRMVLFFGLNSLLSASLLGFVDTWTGRPSRGLQLFVVASWLVFVLISIFWLVYRPMPEGFDVPAQIWTWYTTALGAGVLVRLGWHAFRSGETRLLEAALMSIIAVCIVLDALGQHLGLNTGQYVVQSAPVLLFALIVAFVQRNFRLFQSTVSLNTYLSETLEAREAELTIARARESELFRQQAHLEERRRIMRDMHDGLGSQLMGMLLAARRGKVDAASMAEGLQSVIDEMRLMIDSMDSVGESLASALTTFQERSRPLVERAGFAFTWTTLLDTPLPDYPPRAVLQVFRILQEAVTNALKHSGGDRLEIVVAPEPDGGVRLSISDNGPHGMGDAAKSGHGLRNMQSRAAAIGASLQSNREANRTTIVLVLPLNATPDRS